MSPNYHGVRPWLFLAACLLALPPIAASAPEPVVVDGKVAEWIGAPHLFQAPPTQPGSPAPLVQQVWVHSNQERLSLRFRLSKEVLLQGDSNLVLHIDSDANPGTGRAVDGLGADFTWEFSNREGRYRTLGVPLKVIQSDVGLRQAPTVSATEFEVSFARDATLAGTPFLPDSTIALSLAHVSGDHTLTTTGRLDLVLRQTPAPRPAPVTIPAKAEGQLRILTYNVLFDGIFERPLPFRRILGALDPDIVSLQELYRHSTQETLEWIQRILPDSEWYAAGFGQGVILSRFPVLDWGSIGTERRGAWALLDTPDGNLAVINPHPPCCGNDAGRQEEFDALAAWIRDSRASGLLQRGTPVVVAGDANLVGDSRQLRTLLHGEIVDTRNHGPAAPPDGDGTSLADAMPYHLSGTESYTWRSDSSEFAPGKLDYLVYTDSVLGLGASFVLWTPELSPDALRRHRLEADDTVRASDHLPVVADVYFRDADSSR